MDNPNQNEIFQQEIKERIISLKNNTKLKELSYEWMLESGRQKWSYNFSWFGRPAIQFPNDAWAMQEIIWQVKPDLIIEAGIAHGGSLLYYASLLALIDLCDAVDNNLMYDPKQSKRKIIGLDVDIRKHNRTAIESHPLFNWIHLIEGSSVSNKTICEVTNIAKNHKKILVCLDSNHTHNHVLAELSAYAPLVSKDSYCVVFDTILEDMPFDTSLNRPWGPSNSPMTALNQFLINNNEFVIDSNIHNKLLITVAPNGYLKKIK